MRRRRQQRPTRSGSARRPARCGRRTQDRRDRPAPAARRAAARPACCPLRRHSSPRRADRHVTAAYAPTPRSKARSQGQAGRLRRRPDAVRSPPRGTASRPASRNSRGSVRPNASSAPRIGHQRPESPTQPVRQLLRRPGLVRADQRLQRRIGVLDYQPAARTQRSLNWLRDAPACRQQRSLPRRQMCAFRAVTRGVVSGSPRRVSGSQVAQGCVVATVVLQVSVRATTDAGDGPWLVTVTV